MTTRLMSLLLGFAAASAAALTGLIAASPPAPQAAAEYCVVSGPLSYGGTVLYPGGKYCVPGP